MLCWVACGLLEPCWPQLQLKQYLSISLEVCVTYVPYKPDELFPAFKDCAGPTYLSLTPFLQAPLGSEGLGTGVSGPLRMGGTYTVRITAPRWVETAFFLSPQVSVFFGGLSIKKDEDVLKKNCPHVVVGTPGRILALVRSRSLNLRNVKHFVLDECDKMLEQLGEHPTGLSSWFPIQSHSHFLGGLRGQAVALIVGHMGGQNSGFLGEA